MRPFAYERPASAEHAVALAVREPRAAYLGGGTNLVDLMRLGVLEPTTLVDVRRLTSRAIEPRPDDGLVIGAAATNAQIADHPLVREAYPVLSQALLNGASPQLRNRATTAGNLLQRTRCVYFQDPAKPCNKRAPGSGCSAIEGEHHNLAILGWSEECIATHPSDMAVALVLLDAVVRVQRGDTSLTIPLEELYRPPGRRPDRETVLEHGDLITAVELPPLGIGRRSSYQKARERASFSFALVSVAAALELRDGEVEDVRIALGGVAHKPWRARLAEAALRGRPFDHGNLIHAANAELEHARPLPDNGFKVAMARNMIVRALTELGAAQ